MYYKRKYISPQGEIVLASDGKNLTGLAYTGQKYYDNAIPKESIEKNLEIFEEAVQWLDKYFRGENPGKAPKVKLEGTDFRKQVWEILQNIPYGKVVTYGQIAKEIAKKRKINKMSAQAVGGAVGHNPISIIIPCHRVVGSDGCVTGYAGGVNRKIELLKIEGSYREEFYIPKEKKSN